MHSRLLDWERQNNSFSNFYQVQQGFKVYYDFWLFLSIPIMHSVQYIIVCSKYIISAFRNFNFFYQSESIQVYSNKVCCEVTFWKSGLKMLDELLLAQSLAFQTFLCSIWVGFD